MKKGVINIYKFDEAPYQYKKLAPENFEYIIVIPIKWEKEEVINFLKHIKTRVVFEIFLKTEYIFMIDLEEFFYD